MAILGVAFSLGISIPLTVIDSAFAVEGQGVISTRTGPTTANPYVPSDSPTTYYTVQAGDTLSRIAEKHNAAVEAVKAANGISQHEVLQVGQVLRVPTASEAVAYAGAVGGDLPALTASNVSAVSAPFDGSRQTSSDKDLAGVISGSGNSLDGASETLVSFSESGALVAVSQSSTVITSGGWHNTPAANDSTLTSNLQPTSSSQPTTIIDLYPSSPSREKAVRDSLAQSPDANQAALGREQLNSQLSTVLKEVSASRSQSAQELSYGLKGDIKTLASSALAQSSEASQSNSGNQSPVSTTEAGWSVVDAAAPAAAQVASAPASSQSPEQASIPNGNDVLAAAPLSTDAYSPFSDPAVGQTVSPDMPILPGLREFLPEVPSHFNGYLWPARGILSSGYGWRWGRMHRGIDIAGPIGTPVVAAAGGVVVRSGWNSGGYGNVVDIRHGDGSMTRYAHNSRLLVREGQEVKQGQLISEIGSTGNSTGPHLHFEIHLPSTGTVNPIAYLPSR
ncbi:MAG: LysM peptidoglycan-binding domain-containing M23 family metallopeptidase [Nodosilinea sp. LVE1205-7]